MAIDVLPSSMWVLKKPVQFKGQWKVTARYAVEGVSGKLLDCVRVSYFGNEKTEFGNNVVKHYSLKCFLLLFRGVP